MIHGQKNGWGRLSLITVRFNWTEGCIAISHIDKGDIRSTVEPGMTIEIKP